MKISEIRACLRANAANAGDKGTYADDQLDAAAQLIGNDVARRTVITKVVTTVTVNDGDTSLPAIDALFRAERLIGEPYLVGANVDVGGGLVVHGKGPRLEVWGWDDYNEQNILFGGSDGQPEAIAWETDAGTASIFPEADDTYAVHVPWRKPFTSWTPGIPLLQALLGTGGSSDKVASVRIVSGGAGQISVPTLAFSGGAGTGATVTCTVTAGRVATTTVGGGGGAGFTSAPTVLLTGNGLVSVDTTDQTVNIPDDYLQEALATGGVAALQFPDLKRRFASASWARYETFVERLAGQSSAPRRRRMRRKDDCGRR